MQKNNTQIWQYYLQMKIEKYITTVSTTSAKIY